MYSFNSLEHMWWDPDIHRVYMVRYLIAFTIHGSVHTNHTKKISIENFGFKNLQAFQGHRKVKIGRNENSKIMYRT